MDIAIRHRSAWRNWVLHHGRCLHPFRQRLHWSIKRIALIIHIHTLHTRTPRRAILHLCTRLPILCLPPLALYLHSPSLNLEVDISLLLQFQIGRKEHPLTHANIEHLLQF